MRLELIREVIWLLHRQEDKLLAELKEELAYRRALRAIDKEEREKVNKVISDIKIELKNTRYDINEWERMSIELQTFNEIKKLVRKSRIWQYFIGGNSHDLSPVARETIYDSSR